MVTRGRNRDFWGLLAGRGPGVCQVTHLPETHGPTLPIAHQLAYEEALRPNFDTTHFENHVNLVAPEERFSRTVQRVKKGERSALGSKVGQALIGKSSQLRLFLWVIHSINESSIGALETQL